MPVMSPQHPLHPHETHNAPFMLPIPLLAPEYLHSLLAPNTPLTLSAPPDTPLMALNIPYETPIPPYATYSPSGPWVPTLPASLPYTPDTPTPLLPP